MITTSFSLAGKKALVTGAARGLGQAIAIGLAEAGADLMLIDRDPMTETKEAILTQSRRVALMELDLGEMDGTLAHSVINQSILQLNDLDILVNNAGIIRRLATVEFTNADWQDVIDTNLTSAFYLCQAVGTYFLKNNKRGKIINLASMLSFQGGYMVPSYTATKSALAGLTRALANEWAIHGINVNAIAPGYFETEVTAGIRSDTERNKEVLKRIPAGRYGKPEELKGISVFLASPASDYLHGAVIPVDGGWLAR
ncbi:MAG: 2-dehydro-3-deoxy-D-gluconate 5-dehydrogenase KduD [Saprospiraceae bacterium]|nr:2-dehydro-3-deoxy-D-gluconate 5-dehydrogenase KduD [Saprospiraceae bacterium]